jgi:hypothetical protein
MAVTKKKCGGSQFKSKFLGAGDIRWPHREHYGKGWWTFAINVCVVCLALCFIACGFADCLIWYYSGLDTIMYLKRES